MNKKRIELSLELLAVISIIFAFCAIAVIKEGPSKAFVSYFCWMTVSIVFVAGILFSLFALAKAYAKVEITDGEKNKKLTRRALLIAGSIIIAIGALSELANPAFMPCISAYFLSAAGLFVYYRTHEMTLVISFTKGEYIDALFPGEDEPLI